MFIQFQNKAARLYYLKIKRSLIVVYCSFCTALWPSTFLSRGCKNNLSDASDVDLSIKAISFSFSVYLTMLRMLSMLCYVWKDSQATAFMKYTDAS